MRAAGSLQDPNQLQKQQQQQKNIEQMVGENIMRVCKALL